MKIFKVIRKALLQYRVDTYTLKYEDFSSKSNRFRCLAEDYRTQASDLRLERPAMYRKDIEEFNISSTKYFNKSDHCAHLAKMYLNKKLDLEEELRYYRKA